MTKEKQRDGWERIFYSHVPEDVAAIAVDLIAGAYDDDSYLDFITD